MRCERIMECLEGLSPSALAEKWDNVGLLAGRRDKEVRGVCVALDPTDEVIEQAAAFGADMLLTHHPLIFTPLTRVNTDDIVGRRVVRLLREDICYYAMHTNFDVMGMADAVADEMGLTDRDVLEVTFEDDLSREGIGRTGTLPRVMRLEECALWLKELFGLESVKVFGDPERIVERAALCPGSGKSVAGRAAERADVFITGDIDHHTGLDAMAGGLCVIDAGHYGLEKIFVPYMEEFLKRELPELKVFRAAESSPFRVYAERTGQGGAGDYRPGF